MKICQLPPEGEYLLVRHLIYGDHDLSPAYLSYSSSCGLVIEPFDRERAFASYVDATVFVLDSSRDDCSDTHYKAHGYPLEIGLMGAVHASRYPVLLAI